MTPSRLRVALIGPSRFGLGEPFAGGLEAHTAQLARTLGALGHRVTVFAGTGDAPRPADICVEPILAAGPDYSHCERFDNAMPPGRWEGDDAGYRSVLDAVNVPGSFDVVHNNSLHYLPVVLDGSLEVPVVHTLHTPPFDHLAAAHHHRRCSHAGALHGRGAVVAVSSFLASTWNGVATDVVHNGISPHDWPAGHGGSAHCMWMGRIVPEKAPHLAIDAARLAGRPIVLAGPVHHPRYWDDEIAPRLGTDAVWAGHLSTPALSELCRGAAVGVVTPAWDEPFGLVIAEMLASGLPVAAFARGATPELLSCSVGVLAEPDSATDLAHAICAAARLDRGACRNYATTFLSATRMTQRYVELYRAAISGR